MNSYIPYDAPLPHTLPIDTSHPSILRPSLPPPPPPPPSTAELAQSSSTNGTEVESVKAKTSRYDFVKVRIWTSPPEEMREEGKNLSFNLPNSSSHPSRGHYHVLSRYLVARSLTTALVPKSTAVRISLQCKKRLVDAGRFDITHNEWQQVLEEVVREEEEQQRNPTMPNNPATRIVNPNPNNRINMERFRMIQWFQSSRTPLIVLLYGSPLIGQSVVATKLGNHLNFSSVLQAANAYQVACALRDSGENQPTDQTNMANVEIEKKREGNGDQIGHTDLFENGTIRSLDEVPLYLLPVESESELELIYDQRCRIARDALIQDIGKILHDGRSVVVEGTLVEPSMFGELFDIAPSSASDSSRIDSASFPSSTHHRPTLSQLSDSGILDISPHHPIAPASPTGGMASPPSSSPSTNAIAQASHARPIVISFHLHLPLAHPHRALLMQNIFARDITTMDGMALSPASFESSSPSQGPSSPFSSLSPSLSSHFSPSLLLRNLTWLDSILQRRHEGWSERVDSCIRSSSFSSSSSVTLLPPSSISLHTNPIAIRTMHSKVLQAIQERAQEGFTSNNITNNKMT